MAKDERSQRALDLTTEVIALNSANYTCWHFRRLCLDALPLDATSRARALAAELDYVASVAADSPKNYQLWYHRQAIVERSRDPSQELAFTATVLAEDAKNYHCWAHRQWVIREFDLFADELGYVEQLLDEDFRNNSAWNQRYFVVTRGGALAWTAELVEQETSYALAKIGRGPNNEAAWNYLDGVLTHQTVAAFPQDYPAIRAAVESLAERFPVCAPARAFLVRLYGALGTKPELELAMGLCTVLGTNLDTIRTKYWAYRRGLIEDLLRRQTA